MLSKYAPSAETFFTVSFSGTAGTAAPDSAAFLRQAFISAASTSGLAPSCTATSPAPGLTSLKAFRRDSVRVAPAGAVFTPAFSQAGPYFLRFSGLSARITFENSPLEVKASTVHSIMGRPASGRYCFSPPMRAPDPPASIMASAPSAVFFVLGTLISG